MVVFCLLRQVYCAEENNGSSSDDGKYHFLNNVFYWRDKGANWLILICLFLICIIIQIDMKEIIYIFYFTN